MCLCCDDYDVTGEINTSRFLNFLKSRMVGCFGRAWLLSYQLKAATVLRDKRFRSVNKRD